MVEVVLDLAELIDHLDGVAVEEVCLTELPCLHANRGLALRPPLTTATELVAQTLDTLGTRIADLQAMIGAGAMNMNPVVVTATLSEDAGRVIAVVRGVAKEGLIRQRAGEKAARRVAEQLTAA